MSGISYEKGPTFVSVVAWVLILYGLSSGYGALSRTLVMIFFDGIETRLVFQYAINAVEFAFALAAIWCGQGLRRRVDARRRALIKILWLYIAFVVATNAWAISSHLLALATLSEYTEGVDVARRASHWSLATAAFWLLRSIVEIGICVWVVAQMKSDAVRRVFLD